MIVDPSYNGWTNYETWCVKLWMDNEQSSYHHWRTETKGLIKTTTAIAPFTKEERIIYLLSYALKEWHEDRAMRGRTASVFTDLLNAALSEVNWDEIARHLVDEASE